MAFNNVILAELKGFQPSLPIYTPRFRIKEEYLTSVATEIVCELNKVGSNWSSHGTIDHPSFTRLRKYLASNGLIHMETGWINGDYVLEEFYLNDVLFKVEQRFLSASAMKYVLERGEKHPMKKEEPTQYDAELHEWCILPACAKGLVATGYVRNDSKNRFVNGEFIRTSLLEGIEGDILVTRNTRYKLV